MTTTGPLPPGTVLVAREDVALCSWALREATQAMQRTGRAVPSELLRIAMAFQHAASTASGTAAVESGVDVPSSGHGIELTVAQAAQHLGVSESWVRRLCRSGALPGRRVGGRVLLISRDALALYRKSVA